MKNRGFTLIELLVALTLLMLITGIGTYAYSTYSQYWDKEVGRFDETLSEAKSVVTLFTLLSSIHPYVFAPENRAPYHYFEGGKSVIRSVTANSLSKPGYPAFFELKVEESQGTLVLMYREAPMAEDVILQESQIPAYLYSIELLRGFNDLAFEFYGWPHYNAWIAANNKSSDQVASTGVDDLPSWFGFYSGKDTWMTPNLVRFSLSDSTGISTLEVQIPFIVQERISQYMMEG